MAERPVLLRGGPRARWAYPAVQWDAIRNSVASAKERGQLVDDQVLQYVATSNVVTLPNGGVATVWQWKGRRRHG